MYNMLLTNLILPLMRRVGTAAGVSLALTAPQMATLESAFVILMGVVIDLINSNRERRG